MNKHAKVTALVALALGTTFAIGSTPASVEAGSLLGEDSGSFFLSVQSGGSGQTLAQVRAEAAAAQESGEAVALVGEDSGSFHLSRANATTTLTRAQVQEQMLQAKASGEIVSLIGEDSGSAYLSRQVPEHWTRYAGPNIGTDVGDAQQELHAA